MHEDDSTVYTSTRTTNELDTVLNGELQAVVEWVKRNKLIPNVSKTNCILFGSSHIISSNPQLNIRINVISINQVQETKLLGITIDNKLSWKKHINKILAKMGNGISVIRRYATFLTQNATKTATQTLILSNLDYCPAVWSNANVDMINKLQLIQNRAARTVLQCNYRTKSLFVQDRLLYSLLIFIRNASVKKIPLYYIENYLSVQKIITTSRGMPLKVTLHCQK